MAGKKRQIVSDIIDDDFVSRLRQVADRLGNRKLAAKAAHISLDQLTRYLRGENQPVFYAMVGLCKETGVSLDWLATGIDRARQENDNLADIRAGSGLSIPVIGLAECGLSGWYEPVNWSLDVSLQIPDEDAFAVLAHGLSMVPEGIKQGFVCICSPKTVPSKGDSVHVKRTDGYCTIKTFLHLDDEWLYLQGFLDPDENGYQVSYEDKVRRDQVEQIASVIFVKRKV